MEFFDWLQNTDPAPVALLTGIWLACLLDGLLGDPRSMPHPVVFMARLAVGLENWSRKRIRSEFYAGFLTTWTTLTVTLFCCILLFAVLNAISPILLFFGSVLILYTSLALRSLIVHCLAVHAALVEGNNELAPARKQLAMIVGRDTKQLDQAGIIRACVESAAENISDGVVAPFCFATLAGFAALLTGWADFSLAIAATAAMLYKAVNTMDSIFGYKNEQYILFGRFPAKLDDAANWLPARISALVLIVAAFLCRGNGTLAWKVLLNDRQNHASPNAGYPESAMAGALGLQLGGASYYFGKLIEKPIIGEFLNTPKEFHIKQAVKIMTVGSLIVYCCLPILLFVVACWYIF